MRLTRWRGWRTPCSRFVDQFLDQVDRGGIETCDNAGFDVESPLLDSLDQFRAFQAQFFRQLMDAGGQRQLLLGGASALKPKWPGRSVLCTVPTVGTKANFPAEEGFAVRLRPKTVVKTNREQSLEEARGGQLGRAKGAIRPHGGSWLLHFRVSSVTLRRTGFSVRHACPAAVVRGGGDRCRAVRSVGIEASIKSRLTKGPDQARSLN